MRLAERTLKGTLSSPAAVSLIKAIQVVIILGDLFYCETWRRNWAWDRVPMWDVVSIATRGSLEGHGPRLFHLYVPGGSVFMSASNKSPMERQYSEFRVSPELKADQDSPPSHPHLHAASGRLPHTSPSQAQLASWETGGESPLSRTHTKGSLPFPSLAFLWRQAGTEVVLPRGSARMNQG